MVAFDVVKLVAVSLLIINVFLGVGQYFSTQFIIAGYGTINDSYAVNYNASDFEDVTNMLESNPTIEATGSTWDNVKNVLWAVPNTIANAVALAGAPDDLQDVINTGLDIFMAFMYFIFALTVVSYIRGGG